jgi:hypothetical protein
MNAPLLPTIDALVAFTTMWLILLGLGVRMLRSPATRRTNLTLALVALAVLLVPIAGLPVWSWLFSYYPNPCLPMLGLLIARRCPRFMGVTFFQQADWTATWTFGAVVGSVIYLQPLVWGGFDFYYWGWDSDHAAWLLAAGAVAFLAAGNRFGVLLLMALVAFAISGLESSNCWDYIIDPVYWLASMIVVTRQGWAQLRTRWKNRVPANAPVRGYVAARTSPALVTLAALDTTGGNEAGLKTVQ